MRALIVGGRALRVHSKVFFNISRGFEMRCSIPSVCVAQRYMFTLSVMATLLWSTARADWNLKDVSHGPLGKGALHVHFGTVDLPVDGQWRPIAPSTERGIQEFYLVPTEDTRLRKVGKRMFAAMEKNHIQNSRWILQSGYEGAREYALKHDQRGPASFADFKDFGNWDHLAEDWDQLYWRRDSLSNMLDEDKRNGPFIHLIPNVSFTFQPTKLNATPRQTRRLVAKKDRVPLAFELRPTIDDGRHWVLYTDGRCERVSIDKLMVRSQKAEIRPLLKQSQRQAIKPQANVTYQFFAVANKQIDNNSVFQVRNDVLGETIEFNWQTDKAKDAPPNELEKLLSDARRSSWDPYLMGSNGGVLNVWQSISPENQNQQRNLSVFSILGGRAAVEETLQLQALGTNKESNERTIDIDSLKGVEVKSHPFDEMLGDAEGGKLEIANYVPHDRFFLYVGKPEKLPALMDAGAPFIASLGTSISGNRLNYNIEARYLARLGLSREWLNTVLKSGLISEMAVFTPDLFVIDGTDVTVVARVSQPKLLARMLGLLGLKLTDGEILKLPTDTGSPACISLRGDLLLVSTRESELEKAIELYKQDGTNSLGQSTEFRYMLTQLPITDKTRLFAYMSDPFVRRLVSPRVKINQRRRVLAKAQMEAFTGRAMLAKLDGHDQIDLHSPDSNQYFPADWNRDGIKIEPSGVVRSETYGSLAHMRSLESVSLDRISKEESEAYKFYMENYSRYWRRFFDPIAIRLNDSQADQLELSTFILPLIDNSIYNNLRNVLSHQDDKVRLDIPVVQPEPVVQLSMNFRDEAWEEFVSNFSDLFQQYTGANSGIMDDFGPGFHLAVFDADPIIAVGSGDIFGAFGGGTLLDDGRETFMLPIAVSILTRPCSIMIETKNPERTLRYLREAASTDLQSDSNEFGTSYFCQVGNRNEWVWTLDVFGVAKLRYGIEVVGKYLVIRNIPWSSSDRVVQVVPAQLNGAVLSANPGACQKQLPGLFAAASDGNRRATMSGISRLYPFMLCGAKDVKQAADQHRQLFGFYPRQLAGDSWVWNDYQLSSKNYGHSNRQRQPVFDPDQPFGLMNRVESLKVNMQFEQDGLRSSVTWRLK